MWVLGKLGRSAVLEARGELGREKEEGAQSQGGGREGRLGPAGGTWVGLVPRGPGSTGAVEAGSAMEESRR